MMHDESRGDINPASGNQSSLRLARFPEVSIHYDTLEVVVVGYKGVGKTSLSMRFCENKFLENPKDTLGINYFHRIVTKDGQNIKINVWDTAGVNYPNELVPNIFHSMHAVVMLYDSADRYTFLNLPIWLKYIRRVAEAHVHIFVAATKCDLENPAVNMCDILAFQKKDPVRLFETSAFTGIGINELFMTIVQSVQFQQCPVSRGFVVRRVNQGTCCNSGWSCCGCWDEG